MEKKVFSTGLMILEVAGMKNPPEFTKEGREVWWQALKDLNDRLFLETCKELIKKESWFPAIADIRKLVKHPDDPVLAAAYRRIEKIEEGRKNVSRIKLTEKSV